MRNWCGILLSFDEKWGEGSDISPALKLALDQLSVLNLIYLTVFLKDKIKWGEGGLGESSA